MANSLFQQLTGQSQTSNMFTNPQIQNVKKIVNTIKMAKNPQATINNMIANNPQMQQAINYVNNNGGNPKAAFEKLAKERGFDPNQIINMLK